MCDSKGFERGCSRDSGDHHRDRATIPRVAQDFARQTASVTTGRADNVLTEVYSDHLIAEYFYELPDKVRFYMFNRPYGIMMLMLTLPQKKFPQYYRVTGLPISLNMIKVRTTCSSTNRHSKVDRFHE